MPQPLTGQGVAAGPVVPVPLSAAPVSCVAFSIKAPRSNAAPVYLGGAAVQTGTGYQMDPGDELQYERIQINGQPAYQLNPSDFYVAGNAGDKVTWLASP
jgi:hypothetical protein